LEVEKITTSKVTHTHTHTHTHAHTHPKTHTSTHKQPHNKHTHTHRHTQQHTLSPHPLRLDHALQPASIKISMSEPSWPTACIHTDMHVSRSKCPLLTMLSRAQYAQKPSVCKHSRIN